MGCKYANDPDLITTHCVHIANIHRYDYYVSQNLGEIRTDRAWKSVCLVCVFRSLSHRQKVFNPCFCLYSKGPQNNEKPSIAVQGGVSRTRVSSFLSAEGGYHAEKNSLFLLQACPSCAPHPASHPLEQLCLMFLF